MVTARGIVSNGIVFDSFYWPVSFLIMSGVVSRLEGIFPVRKFYGSSPTRGLG